jgi:chromosome segregation ATPase
MLKAMGIEGDAIDQIIEAHTETVDALKEQRDGYKADAEKVAGLNDELEKAREQLKAAQDNGATASKSSEEQAKELEKLRKAKDALEAEFNAYKESAEAEQSKRAKTDAYRNLIEKAGIAPKYAGAVLRVADLGAVELSEDGTVKDADKLVEKLKGDYPEFVAKKESVGAKTENPPAANHTSGGVSDRAQAVIDRYNARLGIKTDKE